MSECYCAKIENDAVVEVIVCHDDQWAAANFGGVWVCTHERLVGIGWPVVNGEIVPPPSGP